METPRPDPQGGWRATGARWIGWAIERTRTWWQANTVLGIFLVVSFAASLLLWWASGEVYEAVAESDGITGIDRPVLDWIIANRTPTLDAVATGLAWFGGPIVQPIVVAVVIVALSVWWRNWTPLVLMAIATASSGLATVVGKQLVGRLRPPLADAVGPIPETAAFPSGHTLNATVIAGILCYVMLHWHRSRGARTTWVVGLSLYAILMGLSRVYLGHHWLTDVVVGWTLGLAWVLVVVTLHKLWLLARAKHGEPRWITLARERTRKP